MTHAPNPCCHRPDERDSFATAERCDILELWNRADDSAVSIARASVAAGVRTRRHRLRGISERYLILSGTGWVRIGERLARPVVPGDLVFIPPACPQSIENTGTETLVFLAICTPRFVPDCYEDIDL